MVKSLLNAVNKLLSHDDFGKLLLRLAVGGLMMGIAFLLVAGHATAHEPVADARLQHRCGLAVEQAAQLHLAAVGELDGIAQQVDQHLAQAQRIGMDMVARQGRRAVPIRSAGRG